MTLKEPLHPENKRLKIVLFFGILIRVVVFIFQAPFNNDKHFQVVRYIFDTNAIPIANQFDQSFHPPLYYTLASLFLYIGDAKFVQLFSLFLSITTLLVYYWLIKEIDCIASFNIKKYCLLLVCFLPQLILYGNFVSNDTLSIFIGMLIFAQLYRYINEPNLTNQNILALYLGLGLLTKGTFIAYTPILLFLVTLINFKYKKNTKSIICSLVIFVAIFSSVGSYKFVENTVHRGRPLVHNLDPNPRWANKQRPTYAGLDSIYDINVLKLISHPTISPHTKHSYPLMLYGSFWYQYVPDAIHNTPIPLWNTYFFDKTHFNGNGSKFTFLGSLIYTVALVPTFLFALGFIKIILAALYNYKGLGEKHFEKITFQIASLFLFTMNLALVIYAGIKYDVWSCFQSRLLLPSFFAIILFYAEGLECIIEKGAMVRNGILLSSVFLLLLFIGYFSVEIGYIIFKY